MSPDERVTQGQHGLVEARTFQPGVLGGDGSVEGFRVDGKRRRPGRVVGELQPCQELSRRDNRPPPSEAPCVPAGAVRSVAEERSVCR